MDFSPVAERLVTLSNLQTLIGKGYVACNVRYKPGDTYCFWGLGTVKSKTPLPGTELSFIPSDIPYVRVDGNGHISEEELIRAEQVAITYACTGVQLPVSAENFFLFLNNHPKAVPERPVRA